MTTFQRQSGIVKEIAQMVRDYVFRTLLRDVPEPQLREMLQNVKNHKDIEVFRNGKEFAWFDLLDLVDFCGIDLGITIRMRDGEEITFYPGHNFGETGSGIGTPQEKKVAKKPYEHRIIAPTARQTAVHRYNGGQYAGGMPRRPAMSAYMSSGGPGAWGLNDGDDDDEDCTCTADAANVVAVKLSPVPTLKEGKTLPVGEVEVVEETAKVTTAWPDCGLNEDGLPR